jgi:hypothetical protein
MKHLTIIIGLFLVVSTYGQDLHEEITKVFNFYPHKMTSDEQQAVYPKLDNFFEFVKKNRDKYLEALRIELKRDDNNPYFYFDGGNLLLELSKTEQDYQLVADALTRTNLRDLPPDMYLNHLLNLSLNGANVIDAALHVLDDTTFQAYIPQHALKLKYAVGLKFILPRYPPELYIDKLIFKFNRTEFTDLKITYLDLFIYADCCKADEILSTLVSSDNKELSGATQETYKWSKVSQKSNPKAYLKYFEKRKSVMNRISDEAGYELDDFTLKMRKSYECKK